MDSEINEAVESAYRIERDYGFLCDHQSRADATFAAVRRLAETKDVSVIDGCPDWLLRELQEWVHSFRLTGKFGFISNIGSVDHSLIMAAASSILAESIAKPNASARGTRRDVPTTSSRSCSHLESILRQCEARGCSIEDITEGWSQDARVILVAPGIPDVMRAEITHVVEPLRYYATDGSPHNKADEGLVCEKCKTALSFPRPNQSFQRTAFGGR